MLGLVTDSGTLAVVRANPPNCCPKDGGFRDENEVGSGGGLGWCAGTPMAIPPFCGGGAADTDDVGEEEKGGTGGGEGEEEEGIDCR